jgi:uncharacterized protein (DUF1800 family)
LTWLDAPANRKGHTNENFARELMELFTVGVGHFGEPDVKEAARALTGWTVADGSFREVAARQDDGEKTLLGHKGRWSGGDVVRILLDHPATADRLAWRVCNLLMGENAADGRAVSALAETLRTQGLDVGKAVATVLRSSAFFADVNIRTKVLDPVGAVVDPVRALGLWEPPPSTLVRADWAARLGQDLFYPPNVGGWPGGRSWLSTRSVVGRANYAAALVGGEGVGRAAPLDALGLAEAHGSGRGRDAVLTFYSRLVTGVDPDARWLDRTSAALGPATSWGPEAARRAAALTLGSPEAQLA